MDSLPELLARLGRVITVLRKRAGYSSQERFALAVGMHRTNMGLLERGRARNPTMQTLHSVALGLGVSIPDLLTLALSEDSVEHLATGIAPTQQVPPLLPPPSQPWPALKRLQSEASGRVAESPGRRRRKGKRGK